ncbi:MAG: transketolase [Candidatus Sericytochromatia bacterium]|nr:transketolase [Candidatus Sericytochromatia bacterium]
MPATAPTLRDRCVNTIRMLAVDAVDKANSGHPGAPMGMADMAFVLWTEFLRFNPSDTRWVNRDRFVLSAGHASMLLYGLLHLSGYDLPLREIQAFRQWDSKTPGHPEFGHTPGVEVTTGPLGQGFAHAVGMGLGAEMMGARFNTAEFAPIDHYVYGIVSDGDLMEGVASEAASLAGHLGLGNVIVLYDSNSITIEGRTDLAFTEHVGKRFEAYDWHVQHIDGHNHEAIANAIRAAQGEKTRPSLIVAKTTIGYGSPARANTSKAHGEPLGAAETAATKENLGWPAEPTFLIPDEVKAYFAERVTTNKQGYDAWQQKLTAWRAADPVRATQWEAHWQRSTPVDLAEQLVAAVAGQTLATRALSGLCVQKAAELIPAMAGGSADLEPSNNCRIKTSGSVQKGDFGGRNLHFGIREHAMAAMVNGMALYGAWLPFGATFLVFADYMRPSLRLAALMGLRTTMILTHDSIFLGEDGPTHQPIEHLSSLRAIPNLTVWRPADGTEVAVAWAWTLSQATGPSVLALTRQKVPTLQRSADFHVSQVMRGAYILQETAGGKPDVILVATGSEVGIAVTAATELEAGGLKVRIVSMPSMDVFDAQDAAYQESVLPIDHERVVAIEASHAPEWYRWVGRRGLVIGINRFGASAPAEVLAEKFGFTGPQVAGRVRTWLQSFAVTAGR